MKVHIVMAQRKENYPGQYGPEALACMSQYDYDINGQYINEVVFEHLETGEYEAVEHIIIVVDGAEIHRRLEPRSSTEIEGEVVK